MQRREWGIFGGAVLYVVACCATAGWLAVVWGYPSLWGGGQIFAEYAYPLPMTWAFVHPLTMAPVGWVAFRALAWERPALWWLRAGLAVGLVACFVLELMLGGGRWGRTPFVLFPMVDLGWALVVTAMGSARDRWVVGAGAVVVGLGLLGRPSVEAMLDQRAREAALAAIEFESERVRVIGFREDEAFAYYDIEIRAIEGEIPKAVCLDAMRLSEEMAEVAPPSGRQRPVAEMWRPGDGTPYARGAYVERSFRCSLHEFALVPSR